MRRSRIRIHVRLSVRPWLRWGRGKARRWPARPFCIPAARACPGASVTARLDTGDPWIVERPFGRGRVAIVASPLDAEGGTLPVNPDFVPWAHELVDHLASASTGNGNTRPGEPIVIDLDPVPAAGIDSLPVTSPGGISTRATVVRSEGKAQARIDDTAEPGIYQIHGPDPANGSLFATVAADPRESDLRPLEPELVAALAVRVTTDLRVRSQPADRPVIRGRPAQPPRNLALSHPGHTGRALHGNLADAQDGEGQWARRSSHCGRRDRP